MDGLLTAVQTGKREPASTLEASSEPRRISPEQSSRPLIDDEGAAASPDHIRRVLNSKPEHEQLTQVLNVLDPSKGHAKSEDFDIRIPGPAATLILQVLTSTTIPDHWDALDADSREGNKSRNSKPKAALLRSLSSVAGLSAILAQLRLLTAVSRSQNAKGSGNNLHLQALLSVLAALLRPVDFVLRLYTDIFTIFDREVQKQVTWRELVSLVAGSRVLLTAAEALTLVGKQDSSSLVSIQWIGNGSQYASWLGENINYMVSRTNMENPLTWDSTAFLTGRALSLGYTGNSELPLSFSLKQSKEFATEKVLKLLQNN